MKNMDTNDILLGRGRFCYRNPGNVAFRGMIKEHVAKYSFHADRSVKGEIIQSLITQAREQGRVFLVRSLQDDKWCEAHPKLVRSKVSHALRDARNSTNQQQFSKKSSDSVDYKTRQGAMSFMKSSMTVYDWSIKQDLALESGRLEFPLDMPMKTQGVLKNEYYDNSNEILDFHNIKSLDEYESYKHKLGSTIKIGSETEIANLQNTHHLTFERYVFHAAMSANGVNSD